MKYPSLSIIASIMLLAACATAPTPPNSDNHSRTEVLLEAHSQQISQLQEHVLRLENQIQQLQQSKETPSRPRTAAAATPSTPRITPTQILTQARSLHQQKQYAQALQQLNQLDRQNLNDNQAVQSLFLRLQIHQAQHNCQSLIIVGQQLAQRFPQHPHSGEALYHIGQCQWQMQQRDIARDTWRRLIRLQPQSNAAIRARHSLENPSP